MEGPRTTQDYRRLGLIGERPAAFGDLPGFAGDDLAPAWAAFLTSCRRILSQDAVLRPAVEPDAAQRAICAAALALGAGDPQSIRAFIASRFEAWPISPANGAEHGFLTGYYEPVIPGAWEKSDAFNAPLLARPPDLITLQPDAARDDMSAEFTSARRNPAGRLEPYPTRRDIETRSGDAPLIYVRDPIEAYMIQVQGSATISVADERVRLTYAGRNGRPYTSIGRILIERGDVALADMSLARLKQWVRENGQKPGEAGRDLLWRNDSFVFFAIDTTEARRVGPIGGAGTPLLPLRSIAIDRSIWPYGLFFWIDAMLPWEGPAPSPFQRLMVGQDTGSAIVGPARADLYFGAGDEAGALAGGVRHPARMYVLLPSAQP